MSFQAVMVCNTIGMTVTFLVKNTKTYNYMHNYLTWFLRLFFGEKRIYF